ncbi:MAG TPA: sigma factor, partial [Acidimicrobiia bacterium]|nr:sigma factor [Acidimicrobiia bacterium]
MMATVGLRGAPDPGTDDRVAQLDALYRVEYAAMVRLAYTLVGSNAEAEDIVQDALVEVYQRWHEIRKPGAYLRCAVVSRCRSAL